MTIQRPCGSWMTTKYIKLKKSEDEQKCGQEPPEEKEKEKEREAAEDSDQDEREEKELGPLWHKMPKPGTQITMWTGPAYFSERKERKEKEKDTERCHLIRMMPSKEKDGKAKDVQVSQDFIER